MSADCLLAIDQGTTSSRAVIVGPSGTIIAEDRCEFPQHYPRPGWVEHDLEDIWDSVLSSVTSAVEKLPGGWNRIAALGVTNQRETVGIWERRSSRPVSRAIVWQCRRTAEMCDTLRRDHADALHRLTGLTVDPYFSGPKLRWLLDNTPGVRARIGELVAGTIDTWVVWKLTGGAQHLTDPTNACRTMLYDLDQRAWSPELLHLLDIPREILPQVVASGGPFGETAPCEGIPGGIPICAVMGDQQSALFGQGGVEAGQAKNTYGTGCFLLANTGRSRVDSQAGLLSTLACDATGSPCYALEGSVFVAGAAVQWLRDELGVISSSAEVETLAASVPDTAGVSFVPAFVGLGAPYWDAGARGALLGLTRGAGRAHIARAALEAIAHQSVDVLEAMAADGAEVLQLRVDGGASRNNLLMQIQADLAGLTVLRPREVEMTALGAAYLAGISAGLWTDPWKVSEGLERFEPRLDEPERVERRSRWRDAVARVRSNQA